MPGTPIYNEPEYKFTFLTGSLKLEPVRYWIDEEIVPRRWRSDKKQYWVCSEFMRIGPMTWLQADDTLGLLK